MGLGSKGRELIATLTNFTWKFSSSVEYIHCIFFLRNLAT